MPTMAERFWTKVQRGDGCWEWRGGMARNGYGRFVLGYRGKLPIGTTGAHRMAWELAHGPIPAGLLVCHHCDNRRCVRPDHLFLGTNSDNMRDMLAKGRCPRVGKPACSNGHEWTPENTRVYRGFKFCRECDRQRHRREYDATHPTVRRRRTPRPEQEAA